MFWEVFKVKEKMAVDYWAFSCILHRSLLRCPALHSSAEVEKQSAMMLWALREKPGQTTRRHAVSHSKKVECTSGLIDSMVLCQQGSSWCAFLPNASIDFILKLALLEVVWGLLGKMRAVLCFPAYLPGVEGGRDFLYLWKKNPSLQSEWINIGLLLPQHQ